MAIKPSAQVGQGSNPNRKRNTANNISSKQNMPGIDFAGISGGGLPTLDPSATSNYYSQIQTLQSSLANTLSQLRTQRVGLRGDAKVARVDTRMQGQAALGESVGGSLERGMVGSSADLSSRAGIHAGIVSGIAGVNRDLYNQLAQNTLQGTQAGLAAQQGVQQIEATAIAQRMQIQQTEAANAIQIRAAQMQANAQAIQNAAQLEMAQKQLRIERQQEKAFKKMANNYVSPFPSTTSTPTVTPGSYSAYPGHRI